MFKAWGMESPDDLDKRRKENGELIFGSVRARRSKHTFRCASHNINNIPEKAFWQKSKEITEVALGKDGADIRMWQEVGLYWPKINNIDKWHNRLRGRSHGVASVFGYNFLEEEITDVRQ